jgi:hypothetical protein
MNIIKSLFQIVAAIVILIVPFILVYWILNIINIEPMSGITSFMGSFLEPLISNVRSFTGDIFINVGQFEVDLVPLITCGILLLLSTLLTVFAKIINYFQNSMSFVSAKTRVHMAHKQRQEELKQQEKELLSQNVGYVVVRYKLQTTSSAYLISSGLSQGDIRNIFMEQLNKYTYHDAELLKESTEDNFVITFDEVSSSLIFSLSLQENIIKTNQEIDKAGIKMYVTCGVHSVTPTAPKEESAKVANKVCNLAGPGDITCTKTVKDIFEKDRAEHTLNFVSKGVYDLGIGRETEIFTVKRF